MESIVAYTIEHWGDAQAESYVSGLEALCDRLAGLPSLGKAADDLAPGLRWFPYQSHVLFYTPERGGVVIEAILHVRQDPALRFENDV